MPIPNIVGHEVPASGSCGVAVIVGVADGKLQIQSDSVRHCVFRQFPAVWPFGI